MPYVSKRPHLYIGVSVGTGECVALVEQAAHTPRAVHWHRGARVQGNLNIPPGTIIAIFDPGGSYGNRHDGTSHAAIYLGQTADGIQVIDQWEKHEGRHVIPQPAPERTLFFSPHQETVDDGSNCYVVE